LPTLKPDYRKKCAAPVLLHPRHTARPGRKKALGFVLEPRAKCRKPFGGWRV